MKFFEVEVHLCGSVSNPSFNFDATRILILFQVFIFLNVCGLCFVTFLMELAVSGFCIKT